MSQPERKLSRKWYPQLTHLSNTKRSCHNVLPKSNKNICDNHYKPITKHGQIVRGYDPLEKKWHGQFNIENGWLWEWKTRHLCVISVCSRILLTVYFVCKLLNVPNTIFVRSQATDHHHKWKFIFEGELKTTDQCKSSVSTTTTTYSQHGPRVSRCTIHNPSCICCTIKHVITHTHVRSTPKIPLSKLPLPYPTSVRSPPAPRAPFRQISWFTVTRKYLRKIY